MIERGGTLGCKLYWYLKFLQTGSLIRGLEQSGDLFLIGFVKVAMFKLFNQ